MEVISIATTVAVPDGAAIAEQLASSLRTEARGCLQHQIEASGQMPLETARADGATYSSMNTRGLFNLLRVANHTAGGAGLWGWSASDGRGSIRRALDFLIPYATGEMKWPYGQVSDDYTQAWVGLAPQLRQAYLLTGNASYEAAIAKLPWPAGQWPLAWQQDVSQLLWPAKLAINMRRGKETVL